MVRAIESCFRELTNPPNPPPFMFYSKTLMLMTPFPGPPSFGPCPHRAQQVTSLRQNHFLFSARRRPNRNGQKNITGPLLARFSISTCPPLNPRLAAKMFPRPPLYQIEDPPVNLEGTVNPVCCLSTCPYRVKVFFWSVCCDFFDPPICREQHCRVSYF